MDGALRALERAWLTSGALEDGVGLLAARRRAGFVTDEQLALAAFVGDPAAARVAGCPVAPRDLLSCTPGDLSHYVKGVERWGTRAAVRLAVAWVRTLRALDDHRLTSARPHVARGIEAADAWLADPTGPTARAAMEVYTALVDTAFAPARIQDARFYAVEAAASAAQAAAYGAPREGTATAAKRARTTARSAGSAACSVAIVLNELGLDRRAALNAVWWEVGAWALGHTGR